MILRWFWREWKTPALLIVWLALTLSVACVLALGSLSVRIEKGLNQQSREFLAADKVLRSAHPVDENWLIQAQQEGLKVSHQLTFMSMSFAHEKLQLVAVKATDRQYPFYGELLTHPAGLRPKPGEILVASNLLSLLKIKVGDTLEIGDAPLSVVGEVLQEPDSGFNPFQLAPRVLINIADVDKTGAVQPGSRLTYRYLFAGAAEKIALFSQSLMPQLSADQKLIGVESMDGSLGSTLQRSQQFLLLCALLTLLLAMTAVTVAMTHYCRSRYRLIATLKTLGASHKALLSLIGGQWVVLLLLAGAAGSLLGILFEKLLLRLLGSVLPTDLPSSSAWPWLWALGGVVVIALMVGLRPYRQLLATPPVRVLRSDAFRAVWPLRYYLPCLGLFWVGGLFWLVGFNALLWSILLGVLVLALLLGIVGWGALLLLRRLTLRNLAFRLAVNRLLGQQSITLSQLAAFSFSFMLLAMLLVLRGNLLDRWQQQLPPDSPNYFLLNISPSEVSAVKAFLIQHHIEPRTFYPVARVRLTGINGQPAEQFVGKGDAPKDEALDRELNLTWLQDLPAYNPLIAGNWPPKEGEVSIEQGLAQRLNITLGDTVTFRGDTQDFTARVTSLRQVDWENLRPNFYFIFPPGGLDSQPQTWLTSFRYQGDSEMLVQLNREFPTLSLLDIGSLLKQASMILRQVSRALEVMVGLVLFCGLLLLLAQVQVGMQQRQQELMVYRILGAGKRLLQRTLWGEFALLGGVSGVVAVIAAEMTLGWLQRKVFDFPWEANYLMWGLIPLGGMLLLMLCGEILGWRLIKQLPTHQQR